MSDTIAAIATAPGEGGIAIVRISGPDAESVFSSLFVPAKAVPRFHSHHLYYGHVMDGEEVIDECMGVLMRAPHSYTREDVAEFQLHGGYATGALPLRASCGGRGVYTARLSQRTP